MTNTGLDLDLDLNFSTDLDFNADLDFNTEKKENYHRKFKVYDVENDLEEELAKFINRDFDNRKNISKQTDTEYYFVVTFQSREQRDEYLEHTKLNTILEDNYFINGFKAADLINLKIKKIHLPNEKFRKFTDINII